MPEETEGGYVTEEVAIVAFRSSETLSKIAPAILAAQKVLKNPDKNAKNPHFGNRYADLLSCLDSAKDCLNANGCSIIQTYAAAPVGTVAVTTMILHQSGEYICGTCTVPLDRDNAQGYGSAATYARRYGVQAIVGMVAEEDDDGNVASRGASGGKGKSGDEEGQTRKPAKKGLFGNK